MSELVEKAIIGDESALTVLYNETSQTAYSIAVGMLKDENEALDVLQEAYISAFNNLEKLQDKSKFTSWFNRIVSNKCKDYLRKKRPDFLADNTYSTDEGEIEVELEDKNLTFSPEENVDYSETKRLMSEMLDNLPDDQRMVILMYYMQDFSIKEIAEILDVSENTVKSRMNYGKKKLKSQVEDLEKKGTKLYGVSGIMLLPFIRWMLSQSDNNKKFPPIGNILENILGETVSNVGNTAIQNSAAQIVAEQAMNNLGMNLQQKIAIGVAAVVLITGGGTTAVLLKNKTQTAKSDNVVTTYTTVKNSANPEKISIEFSGTSVSSTVSTKSSSTTATVTAEIETTETFSSTTEEKTIKKTTKKTTITKKELLSDDYDLYENSGGTFTFKNCTAGGTVKIPSSYDGTSVTEIGSNAFKNSNATKIYIPSSITSISESAFDGPWGVTLYCKSGSYAEAYAIEKKYDYKIY